MSCGQIAEVGGRFVRCSEEAGHKGDHRGTLKVTVCWQNPRPEPPPPKPRCAALMRLDTPGYDSLPAPVRCNLDDGHADCHDGTAMVAGLLRRLRW